MNSGVREPRYGSNIETPAPLAVVVELLPVPYSARLAAARWGCRCVDGSVEAAVDTCVRTLSTGGGIPINQRERRGALSGCRSGRSQAHRAGRSRLASAGPVASCEVEAVAATEDGLRIRRVGETDTRSDVLPVDRRGRLAVAIERRVTIAGERKRPLIAGNRVGSVGIEEREEVMSLLDGRDRYPSAGLGSRSAFRLP